MLQKPPSKYNCRIWDLLEQFNFSNPIKPLCYYCARTMKLRWIRKFNLLQHVPSFIHVFISDLMMHFLSRTAQVSTQASAHFVCGHAWPRGYNTHQHR